MKNPVSRLGRAGFTLIEILVALILVSLLVAAVFPVLTQQTGKADAPRLAGDLASIRSGMEMFNVDLRNRYAKNLHTLALEAAITGDEYTPRTYGAQHVTRWDGPYTDAIVPDDATNIGSGFGSVIVNAFPLFDIVPTNGGGTTTTPADADFVAIQITGLSADEFATLNDLIDGTADTAINSGLHTGRLRSVGDATAFQTAAVYYLAVPFRE